MLPVLQHVTACICKIYLESIYTHLYPRRTSVMCWTERWIGVRKSGFNSLFGYGNSFLHVWQWCTTLWPFHRPWNLYVGHCIQHNLWVTWWHIISTVYAQERSWYCQPSFKSQENTCPFFVCNPIYTSLRVSIKLDVKGNAYSLQLIHFHLQRDFLIPIHLYNQVYK